MAHYHVTYKLSMAKGWFNKLTPDGLHISFCSHTLRLLRRHILWKTRLSSRRFYRPESHYPRKVPSMEKTFNGFKIYVDDSAETNARIKVIGIGGGGVNAVNRMIQVGIEGIDFLVVDTYTGALSRSQAPLKIEVSRNLINSINFEGDSNRGVADLSKTFFDVLKDADLVLLVAGLGGETGTSCAPFIAQIISDGLSAFTIATVIKPFAFEGTHRMQEAEFGLQALREFVGTVITIPSDGLLNSLEQGAPLADAFRLLDDILLQVVQSITDPITVPGLINLNLADMRSVTARMGMGVIGFGHANGEDRAVEATINALSSPMLGAVNPKAAKGALIYIRGGADLTLAEVNVVSSIIRDAANDDANIIFGAVIDESISDELHVTLLWTGFDYAEDSLALITQAASQPQEKYGAEIFVVWNPEVIQRDDYVSLITALGDIVRSEGGIGVERLRQLNFRMPVGEGLLV